MSDESEDSHIDRSVAQLVALRIGQLQSWAKLLEIGEDRNDLDNCAEWKGTVTFERPPSFEIKKRIINDTSK